MLVVLLHLHQGHPAEFLGLRVSGTDERRWRPYSGTGNAPEVPAPEQCVAQAGTDPGCTDHGEQLF